MTATMLLLLTSIDIVTLLKWAMLAIASRALFTTTVLIVRKRRDREYLDEVAPHTIRSLAARINLRRTAVRLVIHALWVIFALGAIASSPTRISGWVALVTRLVIWVSLIMINVLQSLNSEMDERDDRHLAEFDAGAERRKDAEFRLLRIRISYLLRRLRRRKPPA